MAEEHLVLCGGSRLSMKGQSWRKAPTVRLQLGTGKKHVHLKIRHIIRKVVSQLTPMAADLLEIAAYVYAADQIVTRGGTKTFEYGRKWRRHFRFQVPVRCPDVWCQPSVQNALTSALGFLSDDDYEFGFSRLTRIQPVEQYLFDELDSDDAGFEEVVLFSGGLDSLGGAVQEILQGQRKVLLVSHRSVSKLYARQRNLIADIVQKLSDKSKRPLHIAVEVNKGKNLGRDFSQRSRSFLFAVLGAVVARTFNRNRVRFYENGLTSLNLPISPQALGGRMSRTTHPQALACFQTLFSLLFESAFTVENPFLWKTKAEVLREIKTSGAAQLCARTSSCTHTISRTTMHSHCGMCSQCVDRRMNALAADFSNDEDPKEMYESDVLFGRRDGPDLALAERYVGTALEIDRITSPEAFVQRFAEVSRVLRHVGLPADHAATEIFDLYRRHARDICHTLARIVSAESQAVVRRTHPDNCLLSIAVGRNITAYTSAVASTERHPDLDGENPVADSERFEIRFRGISCYLGATKEFFLFERLNRRRGIYISYAELIADVWQDEHVEKNTIQRTASNLRRRLREAGMEKIVIDGSNRGHYAVTVK